MESFYSQVRDPQPIGRKVAGGVGGLWCQPRILSLASPPTSAPSKLATVVRGLRFPESKPWVAKSRFHAKVEQLETGNGDRLGTQSELQRGWGCAWLMARSCQPIRFVLAVGQ